MLLWHYTSNSYGLPFVSRFIDNYFCAAKADDTSLDLGSTDPGLLRKHSTFKEYSVNGFEFPSIRTFYHIHPQADKLPTKPTPLPLLVFIHGLGGSVAQFSPLLTSLVNVAPCFAIDLPGCGLSAFEPTDPDVYKLVNLAALIAEAVKQHLDIENGQKMIIVGHSLGCSLGSLLASSTSPLGPEISSHVVGFVAICPRAEPLTEQQISTLRYVRYIPAALFDALRLVDQRGGTESASVVRFVGKDADQETKRLQVIFNKQSKSAVFLRMLAGMRPDSSTEGYPGGLPGSEVWTGIKVPMFCLTGEQDHVCPPSNVELIGQWFEHHGPSQSNENGVQSQLPIAAGDVPMSDGRDPEGKHERTHTSHPTTQIPDLRSTSTLTSPESPPRFVLKTAILPKPAAHGLLYATSTVRVLSGLVQSFVSTHIDHRLSLGWQLQHLTTSGKWDVKNLEKWKRIQPVSEPIAGIFRAMKTLREVDERHTPKVFVKDWGAKPGQSQGVRMVIDISHESPVYDPRGLEEGGVEYHKLPTVSKLPPTADEVRAFIALVDTLRDHLTRSDQPDDPVIAVHCHYGFNRTGFFIVSYLVEQVGFTLQDALNLFAEKRAPGIRHEHFVNELFVRYSVGLKRRPTIY